MVTVALPQEESSVVYIVRTLSYSLILFAIVDKNLPRKRNG
ncbi:hypothetical protein [Tahibacter amnicola]